MMSMSQNIKIWIAVLILCFRNIGAFLFILRFAVLFIATSTVTGLICDSGLFPIAGVKWWCKHCILRSLSMQFWYVGCVSLCFALT